MKKNVKRNVVLLTILICNITITFAQNFLNEPQKIVIDYKRNRLFVSNNIGGKLVLIDSNGVQEEYISNAGFIDGIELIGDTIYGVANDRHVKAYNIVTKELIFDTIISGIADNYLSSITYDSLGHLFISCPNTHEIYKFRIKDKAHWSFAKGKGLKNTNGILLEKEKNRIVVIDDCPKPSLIHSISLSDSTNVNTLDSTTFVKPDGIVRDKYGYYYVGGYYLNGIYRFNPDFSGNPVKIYAGSNMVYPTYDYRNHTILVTFYRANSWTTINLSSLGLNELKDDNVEFSIMPNPINDFAKIKFTLQKKSNVKIDIIDNMGRNINSLMNQIVNNGETEISWNVKDKSNKKVEKGIYFLFINIDGVSKSIKILIN